MTRDEIKTAETLLDNRTARTETAIDGDGQCLTAHWIGGGSTRFVTLHEVYEWLQERDRLERTNLDGFGDVILTVGGTVYGRKIYGVFVTEDDARSIDADEMAIGIVGRDKLTYEQAALAARNSEAL